MKKLVLILFSVVMLFSNNFDKYFSYAQNYYWLTVDEGIKSSVYFKTLKYISKAKEELKKSPNKSNAEKLQALEDEVNNFYKMKYYTMDGYFPMLRFISTSFFFFPKKSRQHTLQKPASFIAVENASEALTNNMKILVQNHVFFNSQNSLWNEIAFEKFNSHGKYYAHLTEEAKEVLNDKELAQFYANNITADIANKLLNYVNKSKIYIVRIEKTPLEENDVYVTAYGDTYIKNGKVDGDKSSITFGYSIDERSKWSVLIGIHLILLFLVVIITYLREKELNSKVTASIFVVTLIGFVVGRILPWVLVPGLESFMPSGDLNVLYTFWWVILIGITIILAPIYGMGYIYEKIQNYIKLPSIASKGGIIGFSISAGVLGYLFVPFIFTYGDVLSNIEIFGYFSLFSVAVLLSGYVSGKILDKNDKTDEYFILVFIITSALLFVSLMHTDFIWLVISSIVTIIASLIVLKLRKIEIKQEESLLEEVEVKEDLEDSIKQPNYYKFNYYDEIINTIKDNK